MQSRLVFPMSSWWEWMDGRRNRNYFLFEHLRADVQGSLLIVIEPPALTWRRAVKNLLSWRRYSEKYPCVKKGLLYSVWCVDDHVVLVSFVWNIRSIGVYVARIIPGILKQLNAREIKEIWLWNPFIDASYVKKTFPSSSLIFDAVDDWAHHPVYRAYIRLLKKRYHALLQSADVVFTVTDELKERYFKNHPRAACIPNGVNRARYTATIGHTEKTSFPQIVYVGVIQERFDSALVARCASALTDAQFVIAGPVWKGVNISLLGNYSNIVLKGPVAYHDVPQLLAQSWVGIIPHTVDAFTRSMDPMKLYEYRASGLPVVSTSVVPEIIPEVHIASTPHEFIHCLTDLISSIREKGHHITYLGDSYDWARRYQEMRRWIPYDIPHS